MNTISNLNNLRKRLFKIKLEKNSRGNLRTSWIETYKAQRWSYKSRNPVFWYAEWMIGKSREYDWRERDKSRWYKSKMSFMYHRLKDDYWVSFGRYVDWYE